MTTHVPALIMIVSIKQFHTFFQEYASFKQETKQNQKPDRIINQKGAWHYASRENNTHKKTKRYKTVKKNSKKQTTVQNKVKNVR